MALQSPGAAQTGELVAEIADLVAAANVAHSQPHGRDDAKAFFDSVVEPPFSFTVWARQLRRLGRNHCWVTALILADRYCRQVRVALNACNVHRLMLTALLVAVKVSDDGCSHICRDVARVAGCRASELCAMEQVFLVHLLFEISVSGAEHAAVHGQLAAIKAAAGAAAQKASTTNSRTVANLIPAKFFKGSQFGKSPQLFPAPPQVGHPSSPRHPLGSPRPSAATREGLLPPARTPGCPVRCSSSLAASSAGHPWMLSPQLTQVTGHNRPRSTGAAACLIGPCGSGREPTVGHCVHGVRSLRGRAA
eukprot:TRINITY_DN9557_c0_g1_i1.p1 TRINITY_DN9557_c0_g1~~TRINITY_DN9557_c0_g1_i1.p1  ORF type:complete len:307 (+),score=49.99 TRINITY_DN9557_c0_g1_i1:114-1034(+)